MSNIVKYTGKNIVKSIDQNVDSVWVAESAAPEADPHALGGDADADIAIIGAGFTGISTACHLSEAAPDKRVVVLEARRVANGASGRNGGLALNFLPHIRTTAERAAEHYALTSATIGTIRERADRFAPGSFKSGEIAELASSRQTADALAARVEALSACGVPLSYQEGDAMRARCGASVAVGAAFDPNAGVLNGVAYLAGLARELRRRGVTIYEDTPVGAVRLDAGWRDGQAAHELHAERGVVRARAVVLATNAYTRALGFFRNRIFAMSSRVLATRPLDASERAAIGWADELVAFSDDTPRVAYGSMSPGGRLLFGGGGGDAYRYAFGGSPCDRDAHLPERRAAVQRHLVRYFPHVRDVELQHHWSGPLGLTMSRVCSMGALPGARAVYYGLGYSGNGVMLANLAGRVICDTYLGESHRWRDLPFFERRLEWIPPEPLRWVGFQVFTRLVGRAPRVKLKAARRA